MIPPFKRVTSSKLYQEVLQAQKARLPVVFLAGSCDEGNRWRRDLQRSFAGRLFFIDPYDKQWEAEDNIYDEAAGLMVADYVVFYKGGDGSQKEKKFLNVLGKEYAEFDNFDELQRYLSNIAQPMKLGGSMKSKIAKITERLDAIAGDIQERSPEMALEIDRISDHLERKALYTPMGWMPGRGLNMGLGKGYGMGWIPGERLPEPGEQQRAWLCPQCGRKVRQFGQKGLRPSCPMCRVHMQPC